MSRREWMDEEEINRLAEAVTSGRVTAEQVEALAQQAARMAPGTPVTVMPHGAIITGRAPRSRAPEPVYASPVAFLPFRTATEVERAHRGGLLSYVEARQLLGLPVRWWDHLRFARRWRR